MKHKIGILIAGLYILTAFFGCKTQQNTQTDRSVMAIKPTIVYKTTKNYNKNVAILLSEDKKTIVGYPHPADVSVRNYPTELKKGYLLDNRGIGKNTAFISLTYEEYAALKNAPSLSELWDMIIDKNPIKEMYNCKHPEGEDLVSELNQLIDKKFEGCRKIK